MNQTARQASAMSRRVPPVRVLYIEPMEFIMNTDPVVRQSEQSTDMPNPAAPRAAATSLLADFGGSGGFGGFGGTGPFGSAARAHRGVAAPGTPPDRAHADRGRPAGRHRQVHAVPAGVGRRQPQPGDAVGHLRGAGRPVLPAAGPAAAARPGDPGRRGPHGVRRAGQLPGHAAGRVPPGARRDVYRIAAEPGQARASDPHMPGVMEHVVLGAGRALVGVAGEPVELGPGDYICYPGDLPHVFEAPSRGPSRCWSPSTSEAWLRLLPLSLASGSWLLAPAPFAPGLRRPRGPARSGRSGRPRRAGRRGGRSRRPRRSERRPAPGTRGRPPAPPRPGGRRRAGRKRRDVRLGGGRAAGLPVDHVVAALG